MVKYYRGQTLGIFLAKTLKNSTGWAGRLRMMVASDGTELFNNFLCSMSSKDSESNWRVDTSNNKHWISKTLTYQEGNETKKASFYNDGYITMTADCKKDTIKVYYNGNLLGETVCNHNWLISGGLTDSTIPFTIGLGISGNTYAEYFTKFDLYACRLYSNVLSDEQVKANYNATVAYHNILVNNGNAETGGNTGGTSF